MAVETKARNLIGEAIAGLPVRARSRTLGAALVFACVYALLILNGDKLLGDPDTQWHIVVGSLIWRHGSVPWTDPFSHTFGGQPWMAKEWLSQLILFGAKSAAGWTGVVVVTAATAALLPALVFAWVAERCRATFALAVALLVLVLLAPHCVARPHVFALLPLLLWTRGLVQAVEADRTPSLWLLGILVIWANLHNGFPLAYPIAAALGLEAVLLSPQGRRAQTLLRWGAFGALALAAGCATPYGARVLLLPFVFVGTNEGIPFIMEWQPLGWSAPDLIASLAAFAVVIGLLAGGWRNTLRIVLVVFLAALMTRYSRFVEVFALVAPFVATTPLAMRFADLRADPRARAEDAFLGPALAGVAALALASTALSTFAPNQDVAPRAALTAAREAGVTGPAYNSYNLGGFLIAEGIPTFIDGRPDQLFRGGFIGRLLELAQGSDAPAFMAFIERHGVRWAILDRTAGERRLFEATPGWKRIHQDAHASVFVKEELRGTLH